MTEFTPDMMKQMSKKEFVDRVKVIETEDRQRRAKAIAAFFAIVIAIIGYVLLIVIDWRIALAIWLINWAHNIERNRIKNG